MKDLDDEIRYAFSAYIPACEGGLITFITFMSVSNVLV